MINAKILPTAVYPLMVCLLLTACGRSTTPESAPEDTRPRKQEPRAIQPSVEVAPVQPEAPAPINLSRELLDDIVDEQADTIHAREPMLPDMFKADADDKKTAIGGSLILKDEPSEIREVVDGVEVKIEIPTG